MHHSSSSSTSIVITGASSGIGKALAIRYARPGVVLGLVARNHSRLEAVADECRRAGATVYTATLDVRRRQELENWLHEIDDRAPVDLLIANAGVVEGASPTTGLERPAASHALLDTNLFGVLNAIHPILPLMVARGRGQIAIVSSLAAFFPLTDMPSYSASKAALCSYGLALRQLLLPQGVRVSVICPGYIRTRIFDQQSGSKPFAVSTEVAARLIVRGLDRDRPVIAFPFFFAWVARLGGLLPESIRRWTAPRFTITPRPPSDQARP